MLKKLKIVSASLLLLCSFWTTFPVASALSNTVIFSEVQTGGAGFGNSAQEFVELYNNSELDINISGWKIIYSTSADSSPKDLVNFTGLMKAHSYILLVSPTYPVPNGLVPDATFEYSGGLASTGGHLKLFDSNAVEMDKIGWGTATQPETSAVVAPTGGSSLNRKADQNGLVDTDNNVQDFLLSTTTSPQNGGLGPVPPPPTPVDLCPNTPEIETSIPIGYEIVNGICILITPTTQANCQSIIISEIVPNPTGSDTDTEYIELHNTSDSPVLLVGCFLKVGSGQLELSGTIQPGYKAFYNLTLPNAAGGKVQFITNTTEDSVDYPADMGDDDSWSLIDGTWQKSTLPTPNAANSLPVEGGKGASEEPALEPCPPGKYRNPDTNRCRNIEVASGLTPCKLGQYRSLETNRCRNLGSSTNSLIACAPGQYRNAETNRCRKIGSTGMALVACKTGQYRSPETNRCRKIASTSTATPCKEGYERNKETNRCRKVLAVTANNPLADVASVASKPVSYPVIGVVAIFALGYGIFEYRQDIRKHLSKIKIKK